LHRGHPRTHLAHISPPAIAISTRSR
jgi:hypothetical protein